MNDGAITDDPENVVEHPTLPDYLKTEAEGEEAARAALRKKRDPRLNVKPRMVCQ